MEVVADFDFETYSEAGYVFDFDARKWRLVEGTPKGTSHGLAAVGAAAYCEHPSAEVTSLAYDLKDGKGARHWKPGDPPPLELFDYLRAGGLLEAHNSGFERFVWHYICVPRMGWPAFDYDLQLRCSMAKCAAWSIPTALAKAGDFLHVPVRKNSDGTRLLNKFSKPRNPTKTDLRLRIKAEEDPVDGPKLYDYNVDDIRAEEGVSLRVPDLSPYELRVWQLDQKINARGVHLDMDGVSACVDILDAAKVKYSAELQAITGGSVRTASEVQKMAGFLAGLGWHTDDLTADTVSDTLKRDDLPPVVRRVLEIRQALSASSTAKAYAMQRRANQDGRMRGLFAYYGADRTGRFAGRGPQPQNTPTAGPKVDRCDNCGRHQAYGGPSCLWCGTQGAFLSPREWSFEAAQDALEVLRLRDLATVEYYFGDAFKTVSGCLRALYCAAPGHDLICSDYSAIEAVVLAVVAGEEWRVEVFRTHGKIYEESASRICGIPFAEFERYKAENGEHHPMRKKVGKVAELASGFGGWIGAWKAFGADEHIGSDADIKAAILAWRKASPAIVEFWGGQVRQRGDAWEFDPEFFGLEGAAVQAVLCPGAQYAHRDVVYCMSGDVLYCRLPSGRFLQYHEPRLVPVKCRRSGLPVYSLTYMGRHPSSGAWVRLETYGGKLTENYVQAAARDLLVEAMLNLEPAGYPIVLHVHDEVVAEVPHGFGSLSEFEAIMSRPPAWAAGWPIKAAGGWRGQAYRKD